MVQALRSVPELLEHLRALGAAPRHERALLAAWLGGRALEEAQAGSREPFSRALLAALPGVGAELDALTRVASEHHSADGSTRLLVALSDDGGGLSVESVLLARGRVCVSTQVGCAVGCGFCKTGEGGLIRNLSALEILGQVVLARRRAALGGVVLMGMGEPSHNLRAVQQALEALGTAGRFGHKTLVFSTVGDEHVFAELLAGAVKPALALSLHTTDSEVRRSLLPRAPAVEPRELVTLALDYSRAVGHPLQVQWTLLAGVNDGAAELAELATWLQGERAIVNLIPYNATGPSGNATGPSGNATGPSGIERWSRPPIERTVELVRGLRRAGVAATIRRSGGADVDGACGQLRARLARL